MKKCYKFVRKCYKLRWIGEDVSKKDLRSLRSHCFGFANSTPKGTRLHFCPCGAEIKVLPSSSRRQATVHRTVAFILFESYGGFDHLASKAVISLKQQYPQITLSLLIPYHPAERPIETPPGFDNTYYPPGMEKVPRKLAIVRANRYMVDHVDYLIAYAWHPASNARDLVEYARKLERKGRIAVTVLERFNVAGYS